MKHSLPIGFDQVTAEAAVNVVDHSGSPVAGRSQRDFDVPYSGGLPSVQLNDLSESASLNQAADAGGEDDRLSCGDFVEAGKMEVVEVGVGDQH